MVLQTKTLGMLSFWSGSSVRVSRVALSLPVVNAWYIFMGSFHTRACFLSQLAWLTSICNPTHSDIYIIVFDFLYLHGTNCLHVRSLKCRRKSTLCFDTTQFMTAQDTWCLGWTVCDDMQCKAPACAFEGIQDWFRARSLFCKWFACWELIGRLVAHPV